MARVNVDALRPGMVLAEDLHSSNGRLLLGKGVRLEPTHIRIFKIWGVAAVEIAEIEDAAMDAGPPPVKEIDPAMLRAAEEITQQRFSLSNLDHPLIQELFRACTLRRGQQMVLQQTPPRNWTSADLEAAPVLEPRFIPPHSSKRKNLKSLVDEDVRLATLPNIFMEITRVISDPRSSAIHVGDVISKDANLSATLLRMVNSAFYSLPVKIDTISRAVMIVGTNQLSTLAMGTTVLRMFQNIPAHLVNMKSFWEHSVACGIGTRMIASYKNISDTERLFVAGLLHDIGRLAIYRYLPEEGKEILFRARRKNCLLRAAEFEMLDFDHTQIGGMLLKKWRIPLMLERAVEYHHQPGQCLDSLEASIVYVADILVNALGIGTSGERLVPPISEEVWRELNLSTEIFPKIIQLIDRQVEEVMHNFFDGY